MIDFRTDSKKEDFVILQPDFKIDGYAVKIKKISEGFEVEVGCQTCRVTKSNIEQILFEVNGGEKNSEEINVIIPKGSLKVISSIKSQPILLDESPDFFISKNKKVYAKETYEILTKDFILENDYVSKDGKSGYFLYRQSHRINRYDIKAIVFILETIQKYFEEQL